MTPPRRLKVLSTDELARLNERRLLAYRKKALSLENCPEDADYSPAEVAVLDAGYIWFKSDPRWRGAYEQILERLAQVQRVGGTGR